MPLINTKTTQAISDQTEQKLKSDLGRAIECIKGKSESWLMLAFEPNQKMWFQGSAEPAAIVQVDIFGSASDQEYQALTQQICAIFQAELQIPQNRIYVKYAEYKHWGWNGGNF